MKWPNASSLWFGCRVVRPFKRRNVTIARSGSKYKIGSFVYFLNERGALNNTKCFTFCGSGGGGSIESVHWEGIEGVTPIPVGNLLVRYLFLKTVRGFGTITYVQSTPYASIDILVPAMTEVSKFLVFAKSNSKIGICTKSYVCKKSFPPLLCLSIYPMIRWDGLKRTLVVDKNTGASSSLSHINFLCELFLSF